MNKHLISDKRVIIVPLILIIVAIFTLTMAKDNTKIYIPDIDTFMKIGYCSTPQINKATGELFFTSPMSGVLQVYRLTEKGWPYQLTLFDDGIDWYSLSQDGQKMVVGASTGGSEDAQLFYMNSFTGQIRQLTFTPSVRYAQAVWNKSGDGFYFYANLDSPEDFFVYFYDVTNDSIITVFDKPGRNAIADLSTDESQLLIYHDYSNVSNDLYLLDLADKSFKMVTSGKENVLYDYADIMPDNKTVYLLCNDNPDGILKRARLDTESSQIKYMEDASQWTVDYLTFSRDRRYTAWLTNEEGYSRIYIFDREKNTALPTPSLSGFIDELRLADDGRLFFEYTSPTETKDIWSWNPYTNELIKETQSIYAGIDPNIFVEPQLVKYKTFDGREIPAFVFFPPDYNGQPVPFVIHAHGGPESQFRPYFQRHFQYLLLNGYGIMAPNVRGSRGYGKEYLQLDNYKNRLHSIQDYKSAAEFLIVNKYSEPGKIAIKGASYGGYVALACITEYPDLFAAAWDQVGIANFVTFLKNTRDYRRSIREAEYGPLSDSLFLASISPIHKASLIKTPLMVVHGENDPRVPVGEARQIIKVLQDNNIAVDSLIFPDEGHGIGKLENKLAAYRKMVSFFDEHLMK